MVWKVADESFSTLRVSDLEPQVETSVDFLEKVLELGLMNEYDWISRLCVPDVVAVAKVSEESPVRGVSETYRSQVRFQNLPASKKAEAMSWEWDLLQNL